jgi:1-acyl-sn-glycerol-3-phosphate acyltransferase
MAAERSSGSGRSGARPNLAAVPDDSAAADRRLPRTRPATRKGSKARGATDGRRGGEAGDPIEHAGLPGGDALDPTENGEAPGGNGDSGADGEAGGNSNDAVERGERLSDVDEWGRSQHLRDILARLYDPLYDRWFRVEWDGFDKIPRTGGALLVANHAGAIPADAPSIMHGIERELGRPVYGLADEMFKKVPLVNVAWSRLGGVQAHPDNAYRLLREQQQLVLVFPEGSKGPGKTYGERYQLRRFGRGGFVQIAMRAGVPIIPLAVVGSEETMPIIAKLPAVARLLGVPYVPITANMAFGPLGALVPFPAKMRITVLDPVVLDVLPDQPRYSRSRIMDTSEEIRHAIQQELYAMLRRRRSVWRG